MRQIDRILSMYFTAITALTGDGAGKRRKAGASFAEVAAGAVGGFSDACNAFRQVLGLDFFVSASRLRRKVQMDYFRLRETSCAVGAPRGMEIAMSQRIGHWI